MDKKPRTEFKAVIFDMDGVITNTMRYHFDAWIEVLGRAGIKADCYDIYTREGQAGLSTLKELCRNQHKKLTLPQMKAILLEKEELLKRIVKVKFVPGSRAFLKTLKNRKFLLALVTGTSRHEVKKILPKDILRLFDASVTGDEVKHGKPHPEPFLKALSILKIMAKDAVVVENAPFGIESAKRAHLFCIAIETSLPRKYLVNADMIVKSFKELRHSGFLRIDH